MTQCPGFSIRDENNHHASHRELQAGQGSNLSGHAAAKDQGLTTHRGYGGVLAMKPTPESIAVGVITEKKKAKEGGR